MGFSRWTSLVVLHPPPQWVVLEHAAFIWWDFKCWEALTSFLASLDTLTRQKRVSIKSKCVDSELPAAGMLCDLVLRRPRGSLWGPYPGHGLKCSGCHLTDLSWDEYSAEGCTQVLRAAHLLLTPSAVLRTSSLSLRNLLSFWNWPYPSQVSSLPLFPVVLHNKGEEYGFLPHLLSLLFSYNTFFCWKCRCNLLPGFITTLHELEDLHARLHT